MKLSNRLETIISFVPKNSHVADIGSDHGYVIIELIRRNISNKCFGVENKSGPFNTLLKNVQNIHGIEVSFSDGLKEVPSDYETIIIAGMGFDTIKTIILNDIDKLGCIENLIIDSHTFTYQLRKFLTDNGFYIFKEHCLIENNIFYEIIHFKKGNKIYSDFELKYGPLLVKEKNKDFIDYYTKEAERLRKLVVMHQISPLKKKEYAQKIREMEELINEN